MDGGGFVFKGLQHGVQKDLNITPDIATRKHMKTIVHNLLKVKKIYGSDLKARVFIRDTPLKVISLNRACLCVTTWLVIFSF